MKYEDKLDLREVFQKYGPYWYVFIICIALAMGAAYVFNALSEPVYSAKTSLLISEDRTASPLLPNLGGLGGRESRFNEIAVLQSYPLVKKTLESFTADVSYYEIERILGISTHREIYTNAPFRVKWDRNHQQPFGERFRFTILSEFSYKIVEINDANRPENRKIGQFGDPIKGVGHSFMLEMVVPFNNEQHTEKEYEFVIHDHHNITNRYIRGLDIDFMGREYSVLEITFSAPNRRRAQDFLSKLTEMYIQQHLEEKNHMAKNTISFVDNQLAEVTENLRDSELNLQQFRQRHQVMEVGPLATRLSDELRQLDQQKSVEQVKRQYYDLLMEYIRDDREFSEVFGPSALGIDDPLLNSLLMDLSKLHNERARMLLTTTVSTPSVLAIEENIRHSKANLQENIQSLKAANEIMIDDLNQRISRIEQRINQMPQTERELINIQRPFNQNQATHNFLVEKRAEAGIGLASMIPDHKILDPAHYTGTVSPKKNLNYTLAVGFGILIPFIFLGIRDYFNTRIIDMNMITKIVDYPIVGLIPHYPKISKMRDPNPVLFDETRAPIVEAFRSMRSNLMLFAPKTKSKLIVVTSTRAKEGKTFMAMKLAGSFHLLNRKTIYINADMRKPSILFNENISGNVGLASYLTGKIDADELINQCGQNDNLYMIPSGKIPPNASELLASESMDQLLERLQSFEYIIIDTPPIGLVSDAMPLITRADINIYVLRHGYSQHSDLDFLRGLSRNATLKNMTLAINDVKTTGRYGYGHGYGYGLGYGIGYGEENKSQKKKSKLAY